VTEAIQPWLIRAELLRRTRRGRAVTKKAFEHPGLEVPIHIDDNAAYAGAACEDRS
jgi:Holliday junction resolvasome RuvABC ATP-dependent DNA helicase subunit